VAIFDFTEAAKNAAIGIGLQILSNNAHRLISHLSLGNGHFSELKTHPDQ
jgi:hypothetical protein